jgi:hypothetical protein
MGHLTKINSVVTCVKVVFFCVAMLASSAAHALPKIASLTRLPANLEAVMRVKPADLHCVLEAKFDDTSLLDQKIDVADQLVKSRQGQNARFVVKQENEAGGSVSHEVLVGMSLRGANLVVTLQTWKMRSSSSGGTVASPQWEMTQEVQRVNSLSSIGAKEWVLTLNSPEQAIRVLGKDQAPIVLPLLADLRCH